jgi:hypothetical protein
MHWRGCGHGYEALEWQGKEEGTMGTHRTQKNDEVKEKEGNDVGRAQWD